MNFKNVSSLFQIHKHIHTCMYMYVCTELFLGESFDMGRERPATEQDLVLRPGL